jgi:hypothetical protein
MSNLALLVIALSTQASNKLLPAWKLDLGVQTHTQNQAFYNKYSKLRTYKINFRDQSHIALFADLKRKLGTTRNDPQELSKYALRFKNKPSRSGLTEFAYAFYHVQDPTGKESGFYTVATDDYFILPTLYTQMAERYTGEISIAEANLICMMDSKLALDAGVAVNLYQQLNAKGLVFEQTARSFWSFVMNEFNLDGDHSDLLPSVIKDAERYVEDNPNSRAARLLKTRILTTKAILKKDKSEYRKSLQLLKAFFDEIAINSKDKYDRLGAKINGNLVQSDLENVDKIFKFRFKS